MLKYVVEDEYNGKTVNEYLRFRLHISGSLIKQMKRHENAILLDDCPVFVNHSIKAGSILTLTISFDDEQSENILPDIDGANESLLDIIYEDDDLLIINKPSGLPSHPSLHHYIGTLGNLVVGYYAKAGQNFVYRCVNRLDKGTSGLCVIAKHAYAQELLKKQLHTDEFVREYIAIVCGDLSGSGIIDEPIGRCSDSVIKRMVSPDGDSAVTEYTVLKHSASRSVVRLRLKTGRTHQIRVHMSYINHPLLGDFLYGSECDEIDRPALHSEKISLIHPITNAKISFTAKMPQDMKKLAQNLN